MKYKIILNKKEIHNKMNKMDVLYRKELYDSVKRLINYEFQSCKYYWKNCINCDMDETIDTGSKDEFNKERYIFENNLTEIKLKNLINDFIIICIQEGVIGFRNGVVSWKDKNKLFDMFILEKQPYDRELFDIVLILFVSSYFSDLKTETNQYYWTTIANSKDISNMKEEYTFEFEENKIINGWR